MLGISKEKSQRARSMRRFLSIAVAVVVAHAVRSSVPFRAPAIPIFTTDPFMQTWIRGDAAPSGDVSHWYAAPSGDVSHWNRVCTFDVSNLSCARVDVFPPVS